MQAEKRCKTLNLNTFMGGFNRSVSATLVCQLQAKLKYITENEKTLHKIIFN